MKNSLSLLLSSCLTLSLTSFSFACTHVGTTEDPGSNEHVISADEATVQDSDSESQTLPKTAEGEADADTLGQDRAIAKEAQPLVENVSIIFEGKSTKLPKSSDALLKEVANQMKLDAALKVRLDAYSEKEGKPAQNKKMALESLDNVKKKLVKLGVDAKRIRVSTFSKDKIDLDRKVDVVYE